MAYIGSTPEVQAYTLAVDKFNGTGACTEFTLSRPITDSVAIEVLVNSVQQTPDESYTLSAGVVTFTEAPSSGTNNIVITHRATTVFTKVQVGTTDIQPGAVTFSKLGSDVTGNLLANTGVSAGNYGGESAVSVITVGDDGRITYAANVAISIPTQYETANAMPTMLMLSGM